MMALSLFNLPLAWKTFSGVARHALGRMSAQEQDFIPESEWPKVYRDARIWVGLYALIIGTALYLHSWLPLMLVGLPSLYGAWLGYLFGISQHVGLAEDVLDHRSNCRTIYMNRVLRFIYMNMNYHLEHHMYPMRSAATARRRMPTCGRPTRKSFRRSGASAATPAISSNAPPVARELAPAGLRSSPNNPSDLHRTDESRAASQPSASKLARHRVRASHWR